MKKLIKSNVKNVSKVQLKRIKVKEEVKVEEERGSFKLSAIRLT